MWLVRQLDANSTLVQVLWKLPSGAMGPGRGLEKAEAPVWGRGGIARPREDSNGLTIEEEPKSGIGAFIEPHLTISRPNNTPRGVTVRGTTQAHTARIKVGPPGR